MAMGSSAYSTLPAKMEKKEFEIRMPNLEEYDKETVLSYEKRSPWHIPERSSSGSLP